MSSLQAKASQLASQIQALGYRQDALAEQYDQAQLQVQALAGKVSQAKAALEAAQAAEAKAKKSLVQDALQAYMDGGTDPYSSGASPLKQADLGIVRAEYASTLAADQKDAIDSYRLASLQERAAQANLESEQAAASAQAKKVAQAEAAAAQAASQLQGLESQVKGQIATLVAQQQAAAAAAAQKAAEERLAQERAAAAAALAAQQAAADAAARQASPGSSGSSSQFRPSSSFTPPPLSSAAAVAVAAAESRVGDWYQWGAAGPTTFDCSGLVMWAYAQAGISLPHFSGAQYADTTHIPMSDLEPGDLVFPADPGEHVAMYVGNGMIVEAPYTGAQVHIVPMSSFFVLASRVS